MAEHKTTELRNRSERGAEARAGYLAYGAVFEVALSLLGTGRDPWVLSLFNVKSFVDPTGDPHERFLIQVAAMSRPPRPDRDAFPTLPRRPIRLVLDGVTHLPNIGTLFRLCDAFRVERLYVCGFDLELHKRRLTRAAAGTLGWVPWEPRATATEIVLESRASGYSIASIELCEESVRPEAMRTDSPLCLVLGAERHGVSQAVLALSDQLIEIPTDGMGGSINLTTAAAIVVYEASRRFPLKDPQE